MPKIGLRNIKTAISVCICLFIYVVITLIALAITHNYVKSILYATRVYTPFFACIATAYSVGTTKNTSISQAKVRIIASIIGGTIGILLIAIYSEFLGLKWPFSFISATGNPTNGADGTNYNAKYLLSFIVPIILVALVSVLVVWICNLFKQRNASFIAVLTLTAVCSSFGTMPIIYGFNRIFSTIIGVLVALAVNRFELPKYKNKNKLFVVSLDGIFKTDSKPISGYSSYVVNHLIDSGANITMFSTRTPVSLIPMMGDISLNMPVVCMSGAAVYDIAKKEYLYVENIDTFTSVKLLRAFKNLNINPFINLIDENVLYTYNVDPINDGEKIYAKNRKNSAYGCYIHSSYPHYKDILYFVCVVKNEKVQSVLDEFKKEDIENITVQIYDCFEIENNENLHGFSYIKVYSNSINNLNALRFINEFGLKTVSVGTSSYDENLFKNSDKSISTFGSKENLKKVSTLVLPKNDTDYIFKQIRKEFHEK